MNYVYKLYDDKRLVYVGRTTNPAARLSALRRQFGDVAMQLVARHSREQDAMKQELRLIRRHSPPFNRMVTAMGGHVGRTWRRYHAKPAWTWFRRPAKNRLVNL